VLKVELSLEGDSNEWHKYASQPDAHSELDRYGKEFLGQPSVVYRVPFTVGDQAEVQTTGSYEGYGDWDGATGALHPPDATISDLPGKGAGRLATVSDEAGAWRVKVSALPECDPICSAPGRPINLALTAYSTSVDVQFAPSTGGAPPARFDLRYRDGPIDDANFVSAIPLTPPTPGASGPLARTLITGLRPETRYYVAVRALAACGTPSAMAVGSTVTRPAQFVTLHGCFIATAAFGTPMARELDVLRRLRDRRLLAGPLGRLAVAAYYALSPPVAAAIATDEHLRAAARRLIAPLIDVSQAAEVADGGRLH
jgi:hypothetical protein